MKSNPEVPKLSNLSAAKRYSTHYIATAVLAGYSLYNYAVEMKPLITAVFHFHRTQPCGSLKGLRAYSWVTVKNCTIPTVSIPAVSNWQKEWQIFSNGHSVTSGYYWLLLITVNYSLLQVTFNSQTKHMHTGSPHLSALLSLFLPPFLSFQMPSPVPVLIGQIKWDGRN